MLDGTKFSTIQVCLYKNGIGKILKIIFLFQEFERNIYALHFLQDCMQISRAAKILRSVTYTLAVAAETRL